MAKFKMTETIHSYNIYTTRLGTKAAPLKSVDNGKFLKLAAESQYNLAADGDMIEGFQTSSEIDNQGTVEGFAIGGVCHRGLKEVTFNTVCAIGDYVTVGTVVAAGTKLAGPPGVKKATDQDEAKAAPFKARVVSLGKAATGAVGTVGVIELF